MDDETFLGALAMAVPIAILLFIAGAFGNGIHIALVALGRLFS